MSALVVLTLIGALFLALGLWLLLPRGVTWGKPLGALLVAAALGIFASLVPRLGTWASDGVFLILAAVTVLSAIATITFRNPVYCAIWFGLSLLGTAGLFFGFGQLEILSLDIPDFGDHDDFIAANLTRCNKLGQHGSYQSFAVAVRVIRRGVDEIARLPQCLLAAHPG